MALFCLNKKMTKSGLEMRHPISPKFPCKWLIIKSSIKCCKANVAKTTVVIIRSCLIEEAKRLLLFTDMRSSEISAELGFSEQAHFVNFFRRYMNVSPKEYRYGKRAISGYHI